MRELQEEFIGKGEVKGFKFTQIKKTEYAYLYQVEDYSTNRMRYEVFKRRINKRYECVSYPKSKSFGLWAWSIFNYQKALQKFEEISLAKEASNG